MVPVLTAPADAAPVPSPSSPLTFTLITGDRISETPSGAITIVRGPGRAAMRFITKWTDDAHYVIPVDAFGLIRSGRVDIRLFDLTTLHRDGYDDRSTPALPVLVESANGRAVAARAETAVARDLPALGLTALQANNAARAKLWKTTVPAGGQARTLAGGVSRIWLDGKRQLADDISNAQIGVPAAWRKGLTGAGVPVAVLDSGIDMTHPDFAGRIAETANFTTDPDVDDHVGHGTHVASTIAGTGVASAGKYRGVAPGVRLNIGKVCESDGCTDSAIIAGMQWAAQRSRVINMSLGARDTPALDPVEKAVGDLSAKYDSLFVIAAGNDGASANSDGTVSSPGSADAALTVAAADSSDRIAEFSSHGPRVGDAAMKPDIAAPGVGIVAARAVHGSETDEGPAEGYTMMSGTSMATPHVAAAAAILTGQHPSWTAARRKEALMGSTRWLNPFGVLEQGAGRLDVARAITQNITVDGGNLNFGRQAWPHTDDKPLTKRVTYRNSSTKPVTLRLALTPARPGFTLTTRTLTVRAGGTASTSLRVDTRVPSRTGVQDGYLAATGAGGVQVHTPYAVDKEVESYTVRLNYRNRDGSPANDVGTALEGTDVRSSWFDVGDESSMTFRVPRGTYGLAGYVFQGRETETAKDDQSTVLGQPGLIVNHSMTVQMDARLGKPVAISVPPHDAAQNEGMINFRWPEYQSGAFVPSFHQVAIGSIGSRRAVPGFATTLTGTFARPGRNSPYLYELFLINRGAVPNGYRRAVRDTELATIDATYTSDAPAAVGSRTWEGTLGDDDSWNGFSGLVEFDMPFRRTEHISVDRELGWATEVDAQSTAGLARVRSPRRTYPAGQVTTETWRLPIP